MYEEVVKQGYFPANPDSVRARFGCFGMALLVLAAGVGFRDWRQWLHHSPTLALRQG